jgi:hypothetical protein
MPRLPNAERAILQLRKLEDYCLDPEHPRGRHKARVFRSTLGLEHRDSRWLREVLLDGARTIDAVEVASAIYGS